MATLDQCLEFLRAQGTDALPHSQQSLLDHLLGTHQLLHDWGNPPWICQAGLFHSIYGTEAYRHITVPLELRRQVREVIGMDAESLAYCFGAMTRASFHANRDSAEPASIEDRFTGQTIRLAPQEWCALNELFLANALEQLPRIVSDRQQSFWERFRWILPFLSPAAAAVFRAGDTARTGEG